MRTAPHRTTRRPCQRARERPAPASRSPLTLADLGDDQLLDHAFAWLCHRRRRYPDAADIWSFRHRWPAEKRRLQADLRRGHVLLGLLTRITKADGTVLDLWSARDALVLKALALVLQEYLPRSRRCTHLKGHGGSKAALGASWPRSRPIASSASATCGRITTRSTTSVSSTAWPASSPTGGS